MNFDNHAAAQLGERMGAVVGGFCAELRLAGMSDDEALYLSRQLLDFLMRGSDHTPAPIAPIADAAWNDGARVCMCDFLPNTLMCTCGRLN